MAALLRLGTPLSTSAFRPEVVRGDVHRFDDTLVGELGPVVGEAHHVGRRALKETKALLFPRDEGRSQVLDWRPLLRHRGRRAPGTPSRRRKLVWGKSRQISFDKVLGHATPPVMSSWSTGHPSRPRSIFAAPFPTMMRSLGATVK